MWLLPEEERSPGFHKSIFQVSTWDLTFDRRQLTKITQQSWSKCSPTPTIWAPVSLAWHSKSESYKVSFWKTVTLSGWHGLQPFPSPSTRFQGKFWFPGGFLSQCKEGWRQVSVQNIPVPAGMVTHRTTFFCWGPLLLHSEFYLSTVFIVKENPFFLTMGKANSHVDLGGCQVLWAIKGKRVNY